MQVEIIDKPEPEITGTDDVIVKIEAVGICGTDIHTFLNEHPFVKPPVIVGHECSGEVAACGSTVNNVSQGDRVVIDPVLGCGTCRPCKTGRANVCANVKCRGVHVEGAMQEYFKVRSLDIHKLPDAEDDIAAGAMIEPLSIGAQACWRGGIKENDTIVIFGAGPIGLAVMLNAHCRGAHTILIDMKEDRLARAKELGALCAISANDETLAEQIYSLTSGEGPQVTCDAVGHPEIFKKCVDLVAPTGTVVLLGMDGRHNEVTELEIFRKEISIVGSRMNSNMFPVILERVNKGELNPGHMASHRFSMAEAEKAFSMAVNQPSGFLKAIISF